MLNSRHVQRCYLENGRATLADYCFALAILSNAAIDQVGQDKEAWHILNHARLQVMQEIASRA